MKKTTVVAALALCLALMTGQAQAGTTDSISVTVSLEEVISVSLDNNAWSIGPIALNGSDPLATVTATNDGNVSIDLDIRGADGTGGWTIGTPAGADQFEVSLVSPAITLTAVDQVLQNSVATGGTKTIDMTYTAPSSDIFGGGVDQGFSIVVTASATP